MPACPHYPSRHSLHVPNFRGAIEALVECINTISGVGTTSFTIDPSGYASNFEGLVQVIEDLNFTMSGITAGGGGGGTVYTAGSGLYLVSTTGSGQFNVNFDTIYSQVISGHFFAAADLGVVFSGNNVVYSGSQGGGGGGSSSSGTVTVGTSPGSGYSAGSLWFDTNEGRLFVYASGASVSDPDWYQTNAEALAFKSENPPSGAGYNAPPRDGSLWFNTLMGSLFVYDVTSSGWYETNSARNAAYGAASPAPTVEGALWVDSSVNQIKTWNGSAWISV